MTAAAHGAILETDGASFRYPDGSRGLDCCSLSIERGSRTAVLGANGAGKTTLFLHLNGILRPQSGQVRYDGQPLDYGRSGLQRLRSRVGMVFQNPDSQLFSASVREDVSFGPMNLGLEKTVVRQRVEEVLAAVGLEDIADKPVHNLSFGQKKRVCIAGVLAMRPEVIILDEPFAGLDPVMAAEFSAILDRLHREGVTLVTATHDLDLAYAWSDRAIVLQKGRLLAQGATETVLELPEVHTVLGASPLVPQIARALALTGTGVYAKGYLPRSRAELLQALSSMHGQEQIR